MSNEENGPREPTEEEMLEAMRFEITAHFQMVLGLFAPLANVDIERMADTLFKEQLVLRDEVLPEIVKGNGEIFIAVQDSSGRRGLFRANRSLMASKGECGPMLQTALVYGFIMMPSIRGLLRVLGCKYNFILQAPGATPAGATPDPKKIILTS